MKKSKYRKIFGILLIVYGIVAFITPGIPGAWFIFIGLEFFGIKLLWGEKLKMWWGIFRDKITRTKTKNPLAPSDPIQ